MMILATLNHLNLGINLAIFNGAGDEKKGALSSPPILKENNNWSCKSYASATDENQENSIGKGICEFSFFSTLNWR